MATIQEAKAAAKAAGLSVSKKQVDQDGNQFVKIGEVVLYRTYAASYTLLKKSELNPNKLGAEQDAQTLKTWIFRILEGFEIEAKKEVEAPKNIIEANQGRKAGEAVLAVDNLEIAGCKILEVDKWTLKVLNLSKERSENLVSIVEFSTFGAKSIDDPIRQIINFSREQFRALSSL
tara:strand:- start:50 stop:577 length:528 start_codon:yes stop_codon:yes gene_type:complete